MILHISGGQITTIYDEHLDIRNLGKINIQRASNVEPDNNSKWSADMKLAKGPVLGPFASAARL
jgi:alkyl hydroperoxide reductase subunit AhpF